MDKGDAVSGDAKEPTCEYQLIGPAEDGQIDDLLSGKSVKEGRQRLQALIAEWLHMENLVVLGRRGNLGELGWSDDGHARTCYPRGPDGFARRAIQH